MSSASVWATIGLVAIVTFVSKGIGPFAIGERELPAPLIRVVALLGSALLAALVVTSTVVTQGSFELGAKAIGIGVAALLVWRRAHLLVVVVGAAATTALLRQAGLG